SERREAMKAATTPGTTLLPTPIGQSPRLLRKRPNAAPDGAQAPSRRLMVDRAARHGLAFSIAAKPTATTAARPDPNGPTNGRSARPAITTRRALQGRKRR